MHGMCANYTAIPDHQEIIKSIGDLKIDDSSPFDKISPSVFPFTYAPVIVQHDNDLVLTAKRYALTPAWAKTAKVKWATYNARLNRVSEKSGQMEYIYEVPTWKEAFSSHHCLVPMTGFMESCHEGTGGGHIVQFKPVETDKILFAAGIFADWIDKESGEILSTFAIITTDPDDYIKDVGHDRSPVFLESTIANIWLKKFETGKDAYLFLKENPYRPKLDFSKVRTLKTMKNK